MKKIFIFSMFLCAINCNLFAKQDKKDEITVNTSDSTTVTIVVPDGVTEICDDAKSLLGDAKTLFKKAQKEVEKEVDKRVKTDKDGNTTINLK